MLAQITADVALVMGAYLLGSLPYMLLLGRARGFDLSQEEDLHMALWRKVGRLEGFSGVLVDILKGVIPIIIGIIFELFPFIFIIIVSIKFFLYSLSKTFNFLAINCFSFLGIVFNALSPFLLIIAAYLLGTFDARISKLFILANSTISL